MHHTSLYLNAADVLAVWGRPVEDMVTPDTLHTHGIAIPTLLTYILVTLSSGSLIDLLLTSSVE